MISSSFPRNSIRTSRDIFPLKSSLFFFQDVHGDLELDSDNENPNNSKIEPSKAEAEAIARGLQVSVP